MRRLLLFVPLLLVLTSCAALSKFFKTAFKQPQLVFRSADLRDASLAAATVNLVYELRNPNAIALNLAELDYKFEVEGKQVVAGMPPNGLHIPANGATQLQFPANIKFQDLAPVIETFLNKDNAAYRASGHIGIQTPLGVLRLPISKEGTFEVPKIPAVAFGQPRIANINLSSAQVEIPIVVTNRNSYALPITGLVGGLSIAGANVGNISTGELPDFSGRATKTVTLPLTVNFLQAAQAALALKNGNANVGLNANLASGGVQIPIKLSQNLSFRR